MKKKIFFLFLLFIIALPPSYFFVKNQLKGYDVGMRLIDDQDIEILNQQHILLSKSHQSLENHSIFTYASSFEASEEWREVFEIPGHRSFPILKNKSKSQILTFDYIVDNANDEHGMLKLFMLQGNNLLKIRVKGDDKWHNGIIIPVSQKATSIISLEAKWNKDGAEELLVLPIPQQGFPVSIDVTPTRVVVINDEIQITQKMINNQAFGLPDQTELIVSNYLINPILLDQDNNELLAKGLVKNNSYYSNKELVGISFNETPYDSKVDILLFNEYGNVHLIASNVLLKSNRSSKVILDTNQIKKIYSGEGRKFLAFLNNREQDQLADIQAVIDQRKPFITTVTKVLEVPPVNDGA
jgi:hypothetical protein